VRFLDCCVEVLRNVRRDFDRHVAIGAASAGVDAGKQVAGALNVGCLHELEQLIGRQAGLSGRELLVVGSAFCQRLLENRRIRRHARQRFFGDSFLEVAVEEHRAVDVVEPD
jgi:hypothetical protein